MNKYSYIRFKTVIVSTTRSEILSLVVSLYTVAQRSAYTTFASVLDTRPTHFPNEIVIVKRHSGTQMKLVR